MTIPRARSKPAPASQRRKRQAPAQSKTPSRGWQHHKTPKQQGAPGWRGQLAQASATGRKLRRTGKSISRGQRRIAKRKGAIFGVLSLAVAATAFTLAATGALSEIAAFELGLASDGLAFGAAWIIGEDRHGVTGAQKTKAAVKSRAAVCGAPTVDGDPCRNRGNCPHHKGGGKSTNGKPSKFNGKGPSTNGHKPVTTANPTRSKP